MKKSLIFCMALVLALGLSHSGVADDVVVVDVVPTDPPPVMDIIPTDSPTVLDAVPTVLPSVPEAEKRIYRVTWLDQDGEIFLEEELEEGQPIMQPTSDPYLEGYEFIGWVDANAVRVEGDEPFVFGVPAEKDIVLLPLFSEIIVLEEVPVEESVVNNIEEQKDPVADQPDSQLSTTEGTSPVVRDEKLGDMDVLIIDENLLEEQLPEDVPPPQEIGILVFSSHKGCLRAGDTIELWAELIGFHEGDASLQWQYAKRGSEWVDAPGATGLTHSFSVTAETVDYGWRLVATSIDT